MDLKNIGKYTLLGKIGQGAMGEVYKALDPVLNRHVAIKTMTAAISQDPELRARFLREAQSAARLAHPNIVTLYDFGEDQGRVYMAMELLVGSDLKDMIKGRQLTFDAKLDLMEQVCDALAAAHAMDVVHRDIKPANIHVQPNGQVKIVDFGLARLDSSEATKTGMVMGTPHYMSPEQVRGERAGVRSDVFSLGAVFYEMLANHKPFDADSLHAVFFQVLEHEPVAVTQWDAELPEVLVPFLARSLTKKPDDRYQNAGEMRQALRVVRRALMGEMDVQEALTALQSGATLVPTATASDSGSGWGSRVQGSTALQPDRKAVSRPISKTLPGAASSTAVAPPNRTPLVVGGAVVALLAVGGGVFLWQRTRQAPQPPPTAAPGPDLEAFRNQLISEKLEVAQGRLAVKDYAGAHTKAQEILDELDAKHPDALRIQQEVQAVLGQVEEAANRARAAVKAGDLETASKELAHVISIDPQHPVAKELSGQLDSRFRDRAQQARTEMQRSLAAADEVRAASHKGYVSAVAAAQEAETLFGRREFTLAAQKFLDSKAGFDRARQAALEAQRPSPTPRPYPSTRPAATPTPYVAPSAAPPSQAPAPVPTSAAPTGPSPADEAAVRTVIEAYERAIEGKDIELYKRIWPTLSGADEKRLRDAFQRPTRQDVRITVESVVVDPGGATARARLSRNDTFDGKPLSTTKQTVTLVKRPEGWTIKQIGQ
jgi:eukaryotic-like serine/threonine-protein kinase